MPRAKDGKFVKGSSGNPRGRVRGRSIPQALRYVGDPDEVARIVWDMITDTSYSVKDRQWAIQFYTDRTEGKPVQSVNVHQTEQAIAPAVDFSHLSDDEVETLYAAIKSCPQADPDDPN